MSGGNPMPQKRYSILKVRNADHNSNEEEANGTRNPDETDANNTNARRRVSFHRQRFVQHFDTSADHGRFTHEPHMSSMSSLSEELTRETTIKPPVRVQLGERRKSAGGEETRGFFDGIDKNGGTTMNLTGQFGDRVPLSESTIDENTQFVFESRSIRRVHETSAVTACVFEGLPSRASSRPPSVAPQQPLHSAEEADDSEEHTDALFEEMMPKGANESMPLDISAIPPVTPDQSAARMDTTDRVGRAETFNTRPVEFTMPSVVLERTIQESFGHSPFLLLPQQTNGDDFELMDTKNSLFENTHFAAPAPEQEEVRELSVRIGRLCDLDGTSINPTLMVVDEQFCEDFNKTVEMGEVEEEEEAEGSKKAEENEEQKDEGDRPKSNLGNRTRVVESPVLKPHRMDQSEFSPNTGTYVVANPVLKGQRMDQSRLSEDSSDSFDFSEIQENLNETGRLIERCKQRRSSTNLHQLMENSRIDRSSNLADQSAFGDQSTVGQKSVGDQSSCPPLKQLRMSAVIEEDQPIAVPTALQQTPDRRERKSQTSFDVSMGDQLITPIAPAATPMPREEEMENPTPLMRTKQHLIRSALRIAAPPPLPLDLNVSATPLTRRSVVPSSHLRKGTTPAPNVRTYAESGYLYGPVQLPDHPAIRWARGEGGVGGLNTRPRPLWIPLPDDHFHNPEDARSKDLEWQRAEKILVRVINTFEGRMDLVRAHIFALHSKHAEAVRPARERLERLANQVQQLERTFDERLALRDSLVERIRQQKDEQNSRFLAETEARISAAVVRLKAEWPSADLH